MVGTFDDAMRDQVLETIVAIPSVKPGDCEVYVNDGVVTLSGRVNSYETLCDIERRVSKLSGIHGLRTYVHSDFGKLSEQPRAFSDRRSAARDRRS
jgi:osmotically-inducible protein OsmY